MNYETVKNKAKFWLDEIKKRYDLKDILPCDFFIEPLTVIDMVLIADDIEMLSELVTIHGAKSIAPCICDSIRYIPDLDKNECYKTLRAVDGIDIDDCIKIKQEDMKSAMSEFLNRDES